VRSVFFGRGQYSSAAMVTSVLIQCLFAFLPLTPDLYAPLKHRGKLFPFVGTNGSAHSFR